MTSKILVKNQLKHPHYLVLSMPTRGTSLLKKKSIKTEKLYGRSSQNSRITPGSLQQSLSLTKAPPPPLITYKTSLVTLTTISHAHPQTISYTNITTSHNLQISSNYPLNDPHDLFYLGFLSQPFVNRRAAGKLGGRFLSSSPPPRPALWALRHWPGGCCVGLTSAYG